ncbi:hypothetical protein [Dyadobacter sp. CY347]|uniref:hypothetical protein n=1 Tax=Dyadobacter sp. CY347 TaxID=2909336 RepID=UPI001F1C4755|nr:hypothetical protein [Dyadobacter sp. CY347]MCF2488164.1 hypothetical protein [Dyadobacter sp. CY347]
MTGISAVGRPGPLSVTDALRIFTSAPLSVTGNLSVTLSGAEVKIRDGNPVTLSVVRLSGVETYNSNSLKYIWIVFSNPR